MTPEFENLVSKIISRSGQGCAFSQIAMSYFYYTGSPSMGFPQNNEMAKKWLKRATTCMDFGHAEFISSPSMREWPTRLAWKVLYEGIGRGSKKDDDMIRMIHRLRELRCDPIQKVFEKIHRGEIPKQIKELQCR